MKLSRCSHNEVRFSVGKFVPRSTFDLRDNSRYTEPSYAEFTIKISDHTATIVCSSWRISNGEIHCELTVMTTN